MESEVKEISKGEKWGEKWGEKLSKIQLQIIEAIQNDNRITQVKLSELTGHSETSIDNNIRKLREMGIVTRIGPAKGGYWQLSS